MQSAPGSVLSSENEDSSVLQTTTTSQNGTERSLLASRPTTPNSLAGQLSSVNLNQSIPSGESDKSLPRPSSQKASQLEPTRSPLGSRRSSSARPGKLDLDKTRTGTVKFFSSTKGFGFILDSRMDELMGEEVFVHYTSIGAVRGGATAFKALAEGETVEYTIQKGPKGWQAQNVTGPNGAACVGISTSKPSETPNKRAASGSRSTFPHPSAFDPTVWSSAAYAASPFHAYHFPGSYNPSMGPYSTTPFSYYAASPALLSYYNVASQPHGTFVVDQHASTPAVQSEMPQVSASMQGMYSWPHPSQPHAPPSASSHASQFSLDASGQPYGSSFPPMASAPQSGSQHVPSHSSSQHQATYHRPSGGRLSMPNPVSIPSDPSTQHLRWPDELNDPNDWSHPSLPTH